jgi:uncharacterized protein
MEKQFFSPRLGYISQEQLIDEISKFMHEDGESFYRLVIGTDSQKKHTNGHSQTDVVTAVIVHRQGQGARYFLKKEKIMRTLLLREKIYTETMRSLQIAEELVPKLREQLTDALYDFEIHIDVGPKGPTREMLREVVGMVNGNGYTAKTKPDSWGASSVADKHT